jgi:hypothetical protein
VGACENEDQGTRVHSHTPLLDEEQPAVVELGAVEVLPALQGDVGAPFGQSSLNYSSSDSGSSTSTSEKENVQNRRFSTQFGSEAEHHRSFSTAWTVFVTRVKG